MNPSTRILLNALATYGRSVVALLLGLYSTRWVLSALGATDFGLYGVVGSVIFFITYLNATLSGSVARFYAYSIGLDQSNKKNDEHCDLRHWFNIAIFIHTLFPLILIAIGYPLGMYAVKNWLVIPADRIDACIWVFRFSVLSAFVSMITVPYTAMFQAKQYIMELSLVSIVQTVISFICAYKLATVQSDRLAFYAFYLMAIAVVLGFVQVIWAVCRFKECRIRFSEMIDLCRMREFFTFAGAKMFGSTCVLFRTQGGSILLNQFFAPFVNAAYMVSVQVSSHTTSLAQSLIGALQPAVVTKAGANDMQGMIRYAISLCRIASLLVMIFIVPLAAEISEVLQLWLKNPPGYASSFCFCALVMLLFDKVSVGYMLAANAYGKRILVYEIVLGLILASSLPLTYIAFKCGLNPYMLSACLAATMFFNAMARVFFCRWQLKMSVMYWVKSVLLPVMVVSFLGYGIAYSVRYVMPASLIRVVVVSCVSATAVLIGGWYVIFSKEERDFVMRLIRKVKGVICR